MKVVKLYQVNVWGESFGKHILCVSPQKRGAAAERRLSVGFLTNMRDSIVQRLGHSAVFSLPASCGPPAPELLLSSGDKTQTSEVDETAAFLPEFPHRLFPEQEHYKVPPPSAGEGEKCRNTCKRRLFHQILGFIAKGSYGPIVRVKDGFKDQLFAVKVGDDL